MKINKLQLFLLTITITSTFLVFLNRIHLSLAISFIILLLSLFTLKRNKRIFFFTIIISLATIITNILIINCKSKESIDIYDGINILEGTWQYNDLGGTYIFNSDYTYTNYIFSDTEDNYCKGSYKYEYGGIGKSGAIIKEDTNFYYYNLILKEEYCIINKQNTNTKNNNEFIFSIGKTNNKKLLINKNTEELFILYKK